MHNIGTQERSDPRNDTKQHETKTTNFVCLASCHFVSFRGSSFSVCPNLISFDLDHAHGQPVPRYNSKAMTNDLIQSDPAIMMGKPVVVGTRITVQLILEKLAAGETIEQMLDAHPRLTREGMAAALEFAAQTLCSLRPQE